MTSTDRARPVRSDAGQRAAIQQDIKLIYFAWLRARIGHAEEIFRNPPR